MVNRLNLGYNHAGRIMDQLERAGIVGPNEGSKVRKVNYLDETDLDEFLAGGSELYTRHSFLF